MKKLVLLTLFCSVLVQANVVEKNNIQVTCVDATKYSGKYFLTESKLTIGDLIKSAEYYPIKIKIKNNSLASIKPKGWFDKPMDFPIYFEAIREELSYLRVYYSPYSIICKIMKGMGFLYLIWGLGYSTYETFYLERSSAIGPFMAMSGNFTMAIIENLLNKRITLSHLCTLQEQLSKLLLLDQKIKAGEEVERFILLSKENYQKGSFTLSLAQGEDIFDFDCIFKEEPNLISQK